MYYGYCFPKHISEKQTNKQNKIKNETKHRLQPLVFKQRYKFCRKGGHYRAQSFLLSLHRQLTMWNSSVRFSSKTDCSIASGVREQNLHCSAVIACSLLFERASAEHSTSIFLLQASQKGMNACVGTLSTEVVPWGSCILLKNLNK